MQVCRSLALAIVVCLAGCARGQPDQGQNFHLYKNNEVHYSFAVPVGFGHQTDDMEGMYFGYANTSHFGQVSVQSYDNLSSIVSCSPEVTGVSTSESLAGTNGNTTWGRVDAFDRPMADFPPGTQPLCRPPILEWNYDEAKGGVLRLSNDAAYVLCSGRNGKTVLICISQVTDNPALAEQIFMTFRWTD